VEESRRRRRKRRRQSCPDLRAGSSRTRGRRTTNLPNARRRKRMKTMRMLEQEHRR